MAESARQDIEITFGGKPYRVRPTFEIIITIEAELNQSSRTVGMKMLRAEAAVAEIAVVVYNVLKDQKGPTRGDVGEILMEDGYGDLLLPLGNYLTRAQRGNKEHEKEAAEAAARAKETGVGNAAADPPKED